MKAWIVQLLIGAYVDCRVMWRYLQCIAREWREARETYGLSLYTVKDFRYRLDWTQDNMDAILDKLYRDILAELNERGWCQATD